MTIDGDGASLNALESGQAWVLKLVLDGMDPDDCLEVQLPTYLLNYTLDRVLDYLFPRTSAAQIKIDRLLDTDSNPDLPALYFIFSDIWDEHHRGLCELSFSTECENPLKLSNIVSQARDVHMNESYVGYKDTDLQDFRSTQCHSYERDAFLPPSDDITLIIQIGKQYRPLEYGVNQGFWESRSELLAWLRSLSVLYFLDKYQVKLESDCKTTNDSILYNIRDLQQKGLISVYGDSSTFVLTDLGRCLIEGLIAETETYIDQYDHFRDVYYRFLGGDLVVGSVQFESNRGIDLRVEMFLNHQLDPIRTVFLLLLYDGTLDTVAGDWRTTIAKESFFEGLLQPVVDRCHSDETTIGILQKLGEDYLVSRRLRTDELQYQQDIISRIRDVPKNQDTENDN